jgi:hypothetical protein
MQRCDSPPPPPPGLPAAGANRDGAAGVNLKSPPAFIAITESKRTDLKMDGKYSASIALPGYRVEMQSAVRTGRGDSVHQGLSGGLVLFIHSSLSCERIPSLCTPHSLFVRVGLPGSPSHTILGVIYRRSVDSDSTASLLKIIAQSLLLQLPTIILGDFNARHSSWCSKSTPAGNQLHDFCVTSYLTVLNQPRVPTWYSGKAGVGNSTIDLALVSDPHLYASCVPDRSLRLTSDHVPLVISSAPPAAASARSPLPSRPIHSRWRTESADWSLFRDIQTAAAPRLMTRLRAYAAAPNEESVGATDHGSKQVIVDRMWCLLRDSTFDAAMVAVGRKKCGRVNREQWYRRVPGVKEANTAFHRAHRSHCRSPTPQSHAAMVEARRHFRVTAAAAKQKVWDDLCSRVEKSGDARGFWSNFQATIGQPPLPVTSVHHSHAQLPMDAASARNSLAQHFADACSPFPHTAKSTENEEHIKVWYRGLKRDEFDPRTDNTSISLATVTRFCQRTRRTAALGADQFSPHFLAEGSESFFIALTYLFNYSYDHGVIPSEWRVANVCALYKGNGADPSSPDSFRPISLTSVVSKIMERIILSIVVPLWSPSQFQSGFRSRQSTYDQHCRLRRLLERTAQSRSYRHIAFLDFKKAFDKVHHLFLLFKLHQRAGIRGKPFRWIAAFLAGRGMRVVADNLQSIWVQLLAGVPQGCVLSPWLFLVFIDDIINGMLQWVIPLLYADDIALVPIAVGRKGDKQLQKALDWVWKWSQKNLMQYGFSKSQIVRFSRAAAEQLKKMRPGSLFTLGTTKLAIVEQYKYLGLIYDQKCSWRAQFDSLYARARHVSHLITRIVTSRHSLVTVRSVRALLLGMLYPLITFAAPFWRLREPERRKLNALIARPLARALLLPHTTHHLSILVECAVPDIQTEWERITLAFVATTLRHADSVSPAAAVIREVADHLARRDEGEYGTVAWTVPAYSLVPTVSKIRSAWCTNECNQLHDSNIPLDFANTDPLTLLQFRRRRLRRFAQIVQLRRWNADPDSCRDLHLMLSTDPEHPHSQDREIPARHLPLYLRHDDRLTAGLRARLRFNRSSLPDSEFRRHFPTRLSPACCAPGCTAAVADVRHLLFCPLYRSIRIDLSLLYHSQPLPRTRGRGSLSYSEHLLPSHTSLPTAQFVLQGELRSVRPRSDRMLKATLNITGEYLRLIDHSAATKPDGRGGIKMI